MKQLLLAVVFVMAAQLPAQAQNSPVVVELFTSQGCSSCPPADEMMDLLVDREDVIALSLHVDYWDYIGWKDEFALPDHAARQRAYAARAGRHSVYTPEMIVNGKSEIVGAKPMALAMAIDKHKEDKTQVALDLRHLSGRGIEIRARSLVSDPEPMEIVVLRFQPKRIARITRGENAGKTIEYRNVVEAWDRVAVWDGTAELVLQVDLRGAYPVVVLVQSENHGPIRAAAQLAYAGN